MAACLFFQVPTCESRIVADGSRPAKAADWARFLSEQPVAGVNNYFSKLDNYPDGSQWKGMPVMNGDEPYCASWHFHHKPEKPYAYLANTHKPIPSRLVEEFVSQGGYGCHDRRCAYYYGGKRQLVGGDVACIVYHELPEYPAAFGKGVTEVLFIVYSAEGKIKARHVVGVGRNDVPLKMMLALYKASLYDSGNGNTLASWPEFHIEVCDTLAVAGVRGDTVALGSESYTYAVDVNNYKLSYAFFTDGDVYYSVPLDSIRQWRKVKGTRLSVDARHVGHPASCHHTSNALMLDDAYHAFMSCPSDSILARRYFEAFPRCRDDLIDAYRLRVGKDFCRHIYMEASDQTYAYTRLIGVIPDSLLVKKFIKVYRGLDGSLCNSGVHQELTRSVLYDIYGRCGDELFRQLSRMTHQQQFDFWRTVFMGSDLSYLWLYDDTLDLYFKGRSLERVKAFPTAYPKEYGIYKEAWRLCVNAVTRQNPFIG